MGITVTKPEKNAEPKKDKKKAKADKEGKAKITSAEKVRKQKILESVPGEVYDVQSKSKSETSIRAVAKKAAALDDKEPLYRPKVSKAKEIALPIQELQETFGMVQSTDQGKAEGKKKGSGGGVLDLRKDQKQSGEKQGPSPKRKSVVLSSPKLKDLMANKKAAEEKASAELAKTQVQKDFKDQEAKRSEGHHKLFRKSEGKDAGHKLVGSDERKGTAFALVAPLLGHFGFNPTKNRKDKDLRMKGIQALLLKKDQSGTSKFLKILRHKVHEGGDINRLKTFGIPDQRQLLTVALSSDSWKYDFGGNLRHYYSPLLRSYIPNNMLERYRGVSPSSPCLSAIDLSSLGERSSVQEQERQRRKAARDKHLDALHEASLDEVHFEFLKELANNQPVSIPLTIMHDIAKEVAPMINQMQAFYNRNLGPTHECTEQATESFMHVLNRVMIYNGM